MNIHEKLGELIQKVKEELAERPNQYVVAYYRKDNDELIGYHASTFCQITDDIFQAKRYAGEDPYGQLGLICGNLRSILERPSEEQLIPSLAEQVKEQFNGLSSTEIWMDAIYLAEGMEKQTFKHTII